MFPDLCDTRAPYAVCEKAGVADAVESVRQGVDQKAADELLGRQPHELLAIAVLRPIIFPPERDGLGVGADQAAV